MVIITMMSAETGLEPAIFFLFFYGIALQISQASRMGICSRITALMLYGLLDEGILMEFWIDGFGMGARKMQKK